MQDFDLLRKYGWNEYWQNRFGDFGFNTSHAPNASQEFTPGRVIVEGTHVYRLVTKDGERLAEVSGKYRFAAQRRADYPTVGDWVVVQTGHATDRASIHALLPRRTCFQRKLAGTEIDSQIVAANVDYVWLVMAANDLNLRRLERYLVAAWESQAIPVVVLSKADTIANHADAIHSIEAVCPGVTVHMVSAETGVGMEALLPYVSDGRTVALLGSSGAGKSTIVNFLLGEVVQTVQAVRDADQRGRHTTTQRSLFPSAAGGLIIDTPGMRELQLWHQESGVDGAFRDIESLAEDCAFRDCQHQAEPGCAVRAAVAAGTLERERLSNYDKMKRELAYMARKEDKAAQAAERSKWKKLSKARRR
ncbi:MAG: ribosome small subunit-dependent GTPase A [Alicyclobacillus sp. RIFOXYA1_FULL_53_8]|nr:MAG: ribosome small subunit-dependent GTPase A [Alicyclobacillus sp. RIFOXYA1_FULL_53_8]